MKVETAKKLLAAIQEDINTDTLVLPTLPDIALQVREKLENNLDVSAQEIADLVATDVAISARLIKVANSPIYRSKGEISNIKMAITSLGNTTTSQLVTSFVIQQLFKPNSTLQEKYFKEFWDHSLKVSSMCRAFTMFAPTLNADQAMLAGLVHQIGKLPVIKSYEKIAEQYFDEEIMNWILKKAHPIIGEIILKSWNFPNELVKVPIDYSNYSRHQVEDLEYVDLVQVAFLQSIVGTDDPDANTDWTQVKAFSKLGFDVDITEMIDEDLTDQIESFMATFN